MGVRIAFVMLFIPLGFLWGIFEMGQLAVAGALWLALGPDEARTDRLVMAAPAAWFIWPLEELHRRTLA